MTYIVSNVLLRIHRQFKKDPLKIFVSSDFRHWTRSAKVYLDLLFSLGLIEKMDKVYLVREKHRINRTTQGYRFRSNK